MTTVAEAFITLRPDTQGFGNEAKRGITGALGPIGAAAGAAMAVVGGVITATAVKGVQAFASFERSMNEVFTLLPGITDDAMGKMSDRVLDFAQTFGTLPEEVVPALYQALSAGVPEGNVFDFLETAQKAAIAGVTELEVAVDGISSVVNAYGEEVITAAETSDIMFTAVRLGKTDFEQLSASLFNVIPTAASLGVTFGDVAAGLATITAQGTPTTVATTQLRQLFVELSKDGGKVAAVFDDIAGKSFRDFIAEGGNVQEALELLEGHANDSGLALSDLFSSVEAGNAALGLTGQASEAFASALEEMGTSAGATEEAYAQMDQGMSRAMEKIRAGWEVLKIHIGEELAPVVERFGAWVVDNMPVIQGHVTAFFEGVGLVAQAVSDALFTTTEDLTVQMDGWDKRFDQSGEVMDGWAVNISENMNTTASAFEKVADFIEEDFAPAFQTFTEWWNNGGGEDTFRTIGTVVTFIIDDVVGSVRELSAITRNVIDDVQGLLAWFGRVDDWLQNDPLGQIRGAAGSWLFGEHHQGGVFGEGGAQRDIFAEPLRSNEGMAVLERGEEILPVGHPRHAGSLAMGGDGASAGLVLNGDIHNYYPEPEPAGRSVRGSLMDAAFLLGRG